MCFLFAQDLKQQLEGEGADVDHRLEASAGTFERKQREEVGAIKEQHLEERKGAIVQAERESAVNGPEDGEISSGGQEQQVSVERTMTLRRKIAKRQLDLVEMLATTQAEVRATAWAKAANTLKR